MKKLTLAISAVSVLAGSTAIWANNLTVPNSFTKNTTISASQMNDNFGAVKNAVDDNDQKIKANASIIQTNANKLSALDAKISSSPNCPEGMTQVGAVCVDTYEASIVDENGDSMDTTSAANAGCQTTGKGCKGVIIAKSVKNADPAVGFNWFQANLACANAGKRLLTNAEWQAAASGTVDPGNDNDGNANSLCNTFSKSTIRKTGLAGSLADQQNSCVSDWGVEDMIGNVNEFVADWMPGNGAESESTHGGTTYGNDRSLVIHIGDKEEDGSKFPAAILRGGSNGGNPGVFSFDAIRQPTITGNNIGFRCAKPL